MKSNTTLPLIFSALIAATLLVTGCADPKAGRAAATSSLIDSGIVGGEAVNASEEIAKSTVGLEAPGYGVFCTAVLVAKNLVVTAGHCTGLTARPNAMSVVFGADLNGTLAKRRVQGGKTTDAWPLLTADKSKNWGDIALLRFEGEAPAGFAPVRLLGTSDQLKDGMDIVLAGYGLTKMRPQTDPEKLMKAHVSLTNSKYSATELMFAQSNGKGACHGDSGGPAYATINGKLFVVGVTSRSATDAGGMNCMEGSIYTSIPGQIEFLKKTAVYLNSNSFVANQPIPQPKDQP